MNKLFEADGQNWSDIMISDFSNPLFQAAFKQYFSDMGYCIEDWNAVFEEMNEDGGAAFVRTTLDGDKVIGFLQFSSIKISSWFFEETCGFIREFWVDGEYRKNGHGAALIRLAEKHFMDNGIYTSILTTDTAARFYEKNGYGEALGCKAKNGDKVFVKHLG